MRKFLEVISEFVGIYILFVGIVFLSSELTSSFGLWWAALMVFVIAIIIERIEHKFKGG